MEFIQLEMFLAAAQERSLLRAAQRVGRSQPALSVALSKLESETGRQLLVRSRRQGCQLTAAGAVLYGYAERMVRLRAEATARLEASAATAEPPPAWLVPCS